MKATDTKSAPTPTLPAAKITPPTTPANAPSRVVPDTSPLAPFYIDPFKLAVLATLLSKGKGPSQYLPQAASLYASAFQYTEDLRFLFYGAKAVKVPGWDVWSLGTNDEWLDVRSACAKYGLGQRHLRDSLKDALPPHIFAYFWHKPVGNIRLPKTLLERVDKLRSQRRSVRAQKGVKPK